MEKQIIFYSRQSAFRHPLGAVEEGREISVQLRLSRRLGVISVNTILCDDANGTRTVYPLYWIGMKDEYDCYQGKIPAQAAGLYWYFFQINGVSGKIYAGRQGREAVLTTDPAAWQLSVYRAEYKTPNWSKGGLFYHIFVDRFNRAGDTPIRRDVRMHTDWYERPDYLPDAQGEIKNQDFFGGNLAGIAAKLRYLSSLGVTCLYLSPIFEANSNHKYDTADYLHIDPMFGNQEDFEKLCEKAKMYGIRIILDGVFNHTGSDSIYFNKNARYPEIGAYQSKDSRYYPWYCFTKYPEEYESWWGIKTLPQINENNEDYQSFICAKQGVVRKWLKAGASGWRLDVADELPDIFIEKLRKATHEQKEDSLLIGEVWEDASNKIAYGRRRHYFEGEQLDGVMNYPLRSALLNFLLYHNAQDLAETLENICENYPKPAIHCLMNGLGTHDTPRVLTVLSGQEIPKSREGQAEFYLNQQQYAKAETLLRHAALLQMFLPGVPCIYYGDEAGMQGGSDPFNRACYPWKRENAKLLLWYKKLGKLRKELPVLKQGDYRTIIAKDGCFVFERQNHYGTLLAGVNLSDKEIILPLERYFENLLTGKPKKEFVLKPNNSAIYYSKLPQNDIDGFFMMEK